MPDQLRIINHILSTLGQAVVNSADSRHPNVIQAKTIMDNSNYEFQTRGWYFNRVFGIELACDIEGKIAIPGECIEFNVAAPTKYYSGPNSKKQLVQRGGKVFDTLNNTDVIGHSVFADLVLLRNVEELPGAAFNYLMHFAAQNAFLDDDGDPGKQQKLEDRTVRAWAALQAAELSALAVNTQDSPIVQTLRYRIGQASSPTNPNFIGGRPI